MTVIANCRRPPRSDNALATHPSRGYNAATMSKPLPSMSTNKPANPSKPPTEGARDALARLTFLGWRGGLAACAACLAASFLLFGYAVVYWRNADMDFMVIYNALVMNDGRPQAFFDHTAYLTILTVQSWFALLHGLGLLDAWTLSAIPPATDAPGFNPARLAGRAACDACFRFLRRRRRAFPHPAQRIRRRDAGHLGVDDPDRGRPPRERGAATGAGAGSLPVRARPREQGAGDPLDRLVAG